MALNIFRCIEYIYHLLLKLCHLKSFVLLPMSTGTLLFIQYKRELLQLSN